MVKIKLEIEHDVNSYTSKNDDFLMYSSKHGELYENDNLDWLINNQSKYAGKIKCIYIDPPYNTGRDFCYNDKRKNKSNNHTLSSDNVWLEFMYSRLSLTKNLLTDDGGIFISIDENEIHNLKILMNHIYGKEKFVGTLTWKKRTIKNDAKFGLSTDNEYILAFCKNPSIYKLSRPFTRTYYKTDDLQDEWRYNSLQCPKTKEQSPKAFFDIIDPKTGIIYKCNPNRVWRTSKEIAEESIKNNKIIFPNTYPFLKNKQPLFRIFKSEDIKKKGEDVLTRGTISNILPQEEVGLNAEATKENIKLFGSNVFTHPKPVRLIKKLIDIIGLKPNDIILDFFAGSGTTAQAVIELNKQENKNIKFILVQNDEPINPKTTGYQFCLDNNLKTTISSLTLQKIRRVENGK